MTTTIVGDGRGNAPMMHTVRAAVRIPRNEGELEAAMTRGETVRIIIPTGKGNKIEDAVAFRTRPLVTGREREGQAPLGKLDEFGVMQPCGMVMVYDDARAAHTYTTEGLILHPQYGVGYMSKKEFDEIVEKRKMAGGTQ
jgi:hypothetical protein